MSEISEVLNIGKMRELQRQFVREREWDQFHTPKNLAMALTVETSELLEIFQWMSEESSQRENLNESQRQAISEEMADVFFFLLRLSDRLEINLEEAFWAKMKKNAEKYPVDLARGNAKKYTDWAKAEK